MNSLPEPILRIPDNIRDDVLGYRSRVEAFVRGDTTPEAFKACRVGMGIYEHRTAGRFMVRVRLGAGMALTHQLMRIAELSETYGNGRLHVTTRQDIQIHDVSLEHTPDIQEQLLAVDLTSRGGGGNTVRNVTACPRSGSCPLERFDVAPYAVQTAESLLQHNHAFNLPRKYKIAFSGCGEDCALASVADLGFFAQFRDGETGFSVFAGGGLGLHPRAGIQIETFISPDEVAEVAEAVRRVFDKHGDRTNKHKARLRYVAARLGPAPFKELYRQELKTLRAEGQTGNIPEIRDLETRFRNKPASDEAGNCSVPEKFAPLLLTEKEPGLATIQLPLPLGDIEVDALKTVAQTAELYGQGIVRATQLQELLITGVPWGHVLEAIASLDSVGLVNGHLTRGPRIVTCTGASTCKLGLCLSRGLAEALTRRFQEAGFTARQDTPVIRISGCPNSCGGHHAADLGLEGRAERRNGRLMPTYVVLAGGHLSEEGARLAAPLGAAPAKDIPELIVEMLASEDMATERMRERMAGYDRDDASLPDDYYCDFGSVEPFSLAGRGPGECGAGVFDVVRVDINEAERFLRTAAKAKSPAVKTDALYQALLAAARSLMLVFGRESRKDREIFSAFESDLIEPGWVRAETRELIRAAYDWKLEESPALGARKEDVAALLARIKELFASLDADLKFRIAPVSRPAPPSEEAQPAETVTRVDLRGVPCPMNFVKTKVALEQLPVGALLEVLLDDGDPVRNVPASLREQGQEVLAVEAVETWHMVRVRRTR